MTLAIKITTAVLAVLLTSLVQSSAARGYTAPLSLCTPAAPTADPSLPAPVSAIASYPAPSSADVTTTGVTLLASVDTGGLAGQVAFELGDASTGVGCTAVQLLPALTGPQVVTVQLRNEKPGVTVPFRIVVTTAAGQVIGSDQTFTTAAAITRLAPGTTLLGVRVGFLTTAAAQALVRARFARPLVFTWQGKQWKATPEQLGASADVAGALARALASAHGGGRSIPVAVTVDPAKVAHYVAYLDRLYSQTARTGSVRRVGRVAEVVTPQPARAVRTQRMEAIIARTLQSATRLPIALQTTETRPEGTGALSIVVRLGDQSLTLYKDGAVVLETPVTTGRPALPTPVGSYDIAWRRSPYTFISPWPKGNPYYYPPAHVRWAMFFYDNDFLHDSYEPTSAYGKGSNFGPYASHGCVHIPAAVMQVLYTTVPDHTPIFVVDS